jgi:hypothetical protein
MSIPEFCSKDRIKLGPDDEIIQAIEQRHDEGYRGDGNTAIVHAACYPPDIAHDWRKGYHGPLRGIRPSAS